MGVMTEPKTIANVGYAGMMHGCVAASFTFAEAVDSAMAVALPWSTRPAKIDGGIVANSGRGVGRRTLLGR